MHAWRERRLPSTCPPSSPGEPCPRPGLAHVPEALPQPMACLHASLIAREQELFADLMPAVTLGPLSALCPQVEQSWRRGPRAALGMWSCVGRGQGHFCLTSRGESCVVCTQQPGELESSSPPLHHSSWPGLPWAAASSLSLQQTSEGRRRLGAAAGLHLPLCTEPVTSGLCGAGPDPSVQGCAGAGTERFLDRVHVRW